MVRQPSLADPEGRTLTASAANGRTVLLVVLPYRLGDATTDTSKKAIRSFLAFPYGVLTLASDESPEARLNRALAHTRPDIVGLSMSYDVSYPWLKSLAETVKTHDQRIAVVAGGPAITTAFSEILGDCPHLDAACYSEGEVGLKNLIDADDLGAALTCDPWVTKAK